MLKRKDGRYQDQVKLPGMDKPKYFYGKTPAEVKKKMAAFSQEQEKGPRFEDCVDQWDKWHETQISESSIHSYKQPTKDVRDWFAGRYIREITADEVNAFVLALAAKGYAKSTVQIRMNCLNMIFDYGMVHRYCQHNPCGPVRLPKGLRKGKRTAPDDSILEIIENSTKTGGALFAYILMYTGLRKSELLALRWEDVDLENRVIYVRRNLYYISKDAKIKEPKTDAGKRTVGIVDKLAAVLPEPGCGYVFGGEKPLTDTQYKKMWREFLAEYGLMDEDGKGRFTPHQLRHAFATTLFEAGVEEMDTKEIMGHASIQVTRDVYTHIRNSRREYTTAKLNRFLNGDACHDNVEDEKIVDFRRI